MHKPGAIVWSGDLVMFVSVFVQRSQAKIFVGYYELFSISTVYAHLLPAVKFLSVVR